MYLIPCKVLLKSLFENVLHLKAILHFQNEFSIDVLSSGSAESN